jgi:hypothetical protein
MKVHVKVRAGEDLPPREVLADVYHHICRRPGAYADMFYHIYQHQLKLGQRFEMPKGQATKFVAKLPCFEIVGPPGDATDPPKICDEPACPFSGTTHVMWKVFEADPDDETGVDWLCDVHAAELLSQENTQIISANQAAEFEMTLEDELAELFEALGEWSDCLFDTLEDATDG